MLTLFISYESVFCCAGLLYALVQILGYWPQRFHYSCPLYCQVITDFNSSILDSLRSKFVRKLSIIIPPHFKPAYVHFLINPDQSLGFYTNL